MAMLTPEQFTALAPKAHWIYVSGFANTEEAFWNAGINSDLRLAHFLAQALHESWNFRRLEENLFYSADRLKAVWPRRFPTDAYATAYANNPIALGNYVYAGRLGNRKPTDGYTYRGRGVFQLTGRDNYELIGDMLMIDLVKSPDLAILPKYVVGIATAYWQSRSCNQPADRDDIRGVTRKINGGLNGLEDRERCLAMVKEVIQ